MNEPLQYAKAMSIKGLAPDEIEQEKARMMRGRDKRLADIAKERGEDVFYSQTEEQVDDDTIAFRIFVYESEATGARQMLDVHRIPDFKKMQTFKLAD